MFKRPEPIDNEIILDPTKVIMSKTDYKGVIQYGNDYFIEVSKYEIYEMMGKPHNMIRHPDMPKVVFKFMWERLHKGENLYAIIKNLAKDGSYYWVMTTFETVYDEDGFIASHFARRKAVPRKAKETFENLYKKIRTIEKVDEKAAENYFYGFIENSGMTYDALFLDIVGMTEEEITTYFQSNNALIDINKEQVKKKSINDNAQNIEDLKKQIELLQSTLEKQEEKKKPPKGFLGKLFS